MNRDVARARQLLAEGACEDAEKLLSMAKGETTGDAKADADALAQRLRQAIKMLEHLPADTLD
jgi:hypothetical protein